jgi:hypothetical protein
MLRPLITLCILFLFCSQAIAEFRTWEDRDGNKYYAEFVRELFDKVTLRTKDGKETRMTVDEFCDNDQKYFRVMVPPSITLNVQNKTTKQFKAFELVQRIHDTFSITETVSIKKKSKRPFTSRLHLDIFLIAKEREPSGNYILLGYSETDFLFKDGKNDAFVFRSDPVKVDQFFLSAAAQRKGEEYEGYILQISDMQGNVVETETNIAGKWSKEAELLPNLKELWTRGAASKRSRHFDKKTGFKVDVPRLTHFRKSG